MATAQTVPVSKTLFGVVVLAIGLAACGGHGVGRASSGGPLSKEETYGYPGASLVLQPPEPNEKPTITAQRALAILNSGNLAGIPSGFNPAHDSKTFAYAIVTADGIASEGGPLPNVNKGLAWVLINAYKSHGGATTTPPEPVKLPHYCPKLDHFVEIVDARTGALGEWSDPAGSC